MLNSYKVDVSVIIPSIGRDTLLDAVRSVVAQEGCSAEAIVVLDRPENKQYVESLLGNTPHRLLLSDGRGASAARNVGLRAANGKYVAFLDDDDCLHDSKCKKQLKAIEKEDRPDRTVAVVATQFIRDDGDRFNSEPSKPNFNHRNFGNYLVERKSIRFKPTYFNTPSPLCPKALALNTMWDEKLKKHQDWDFYLRLMTLPGLTTVYVNEPLVFVQQGSKNSISQRQNWQDGEVWLSKNSRFVDSRARADFIILHILLHALNQKDRTGIKVALRKLNLSPPHLGAAIRFLTGVAVGR